MIRIPFLAAAMLAMMLALPAAPAAAQTPSRLEQVELTDATVGNFIASYPDLEALSDKYGSDDSRQGPMGAMGDIARSQSAMAEFNAVLNKHGFSDVSAWSRVAFSVMLAHQWNEAEKSPSAELDKAVAEVKANQDMPDEQKQMIIEHLESQRKAIKALEPLPGNIEVVQRHRAAIKSATDN